MATNIATLRRSYQRGKTSTPMSECWNDSDILTLEEAAFLLKCCTATLKRQAIVRHIPHKRIGSLWRFSKKALLAWMEEEEVEDVTKAA